MAGIAGHLLEFPPDGELSPSSYNNAISGYLDSITKLDEQKVARADSDQNLLQLLSPSVNSIAYAYVLELRIKSWLRSRQPDLNEGRNVLLRCLSYLQQFDAVQMRYAGSLLRGLIDRTIDIAKAIQQLSQVVMPMLVAILRIDPTSGTLTSTHLRFLRICLQTRAFRQAAQLLQYTIHSFAPARGQYIEGSFLCSPHTDSSAFVNKSTGLTDEMTIGDVHEYFLLGAMAYIGLQQWEDARLYLECLLVSPSMGSPSALQVEAYKKWVLVSCVLKGSLSDLPRGTNSSSIRTIKSIAKAYDVVAEVFQSGNIARLQVEIGAANGIFNEDGNIGLVQLLLARLPRFHILSIQETYSAVPLSTLSRWLDRSVDELHEFIMEMVSEKVLNAAIDLDGAEPVLRFYSNQTTGPLAKTEKEYHAELLLQTKKTNAMAENLKMSDRRLQMTKDYIETYRRRIRTKEPNGGETGGEMMEDRGVAIDEDEDIMMDE